MLELIPGGSLRELLLPPTYGRHVTQTAEFTVLSVEIWTTGLLVNIHNASTSGAPPRLTVEDHFGTKYSLHNSVKVGSRNLQVFTPSVPLGIRSLTIRATDDPDRPVVTFAVPPVRLVHEAEPGVVPYHAPSRLRRPA